MSPAPKIKDDRFSDWSLENLEIIDEGIPPPPVSATDQSVVYEEDKVTAYFDANGRSVRPEMAAYAKVWTQVNGETQLMIVGLHDEPEATA